MKVPDEWFLIPVILCVLFFIGDIWTDNDKFLVLEFLCVIVLLVPLVYPKIEDTRFVMEMQDWLQRNVFEHLKR